MWSALARPLASRGAGAAWLDGMNQVGENLVPGVQSRGSKARASEY